jgi:pimeloyl-ACP methyl ester carboxylesterase
MISPATRKRIFRLVVFLFIILVIMIPFHACMTFRMSKKEVDEFFQSKKINGSQHQYKSGKYNMHYVQAGDEHKPLVLFVHGSPGSLSAFIHFLSDTTITSHALAITTDRPGFGHSNFGTAETSLEKQAATLKPILEKFSHNRPIILVGHSLGGPVIARMAIDYPELVDGLVFVAASIDPELEPNEVWFRAPLATPFLSWLLPRSFRASNEEIYQLKPQLEEMLPRWKEIKCPVIVIQGKKDDLVPAGNADFARTMLVNAPVEFLLRDDMNHFVPWSHPELIQQAVLRLLNQHSQTALKEKSPDHE